MTVGNLGAAQIDLGAGHDARPPRLTELGPRRDARRSLRHSPRLRQGEPAAFAEEGSHVRVAVDLDLPALHVVGLGNSDTSLEVADQPSGLGDRVAVDSQIEALERL